MKNRKMLFRDAFRNIQKRFIAFLSIVTIMTIGISGLMALFNLSVSMKKKGNDYYKEHNFKDFEMVSSMGITADDIEGVSKISGVADVEGVFRSEGTVVAENGNGSITILSETKRIDLPFLTEGKMPEAANECALNPVAMKKYGISVGDTITLHAKEPAGLLKESTFIVTGVVNQPSYIGNNEFLALLSEEAFDKDATSGRFVAAYIKTDVNPEYDFFGNKYKEYVGAVKEDLVEYTESLIAIRTMEVYDEANQKYSEAEEEVNENLAEAEEKLKDGENQLKEKVEEAEKEIADGEKSLKEGRETLDEEIAKAEKQIADAEKELQEKLAAARKEIDDGKAKAESEFASAYEQLCASENQYGVGVSQYNDGKKQYDDAVEKINDGNNQLIEKMEDKKETIDEYATILSLLLEGADAVMDKIEGKHSEVTENENWNDFRYAIFIAKFTATNLPDLPADKRVELLKGLIKGLDYTYQNLPFSDEVKEGMKEVFDAIASQHPKMENLSESAKKIKELIDAENALPDAEKQLAEAKSKLDSARSQLDSGWSAYNSKKEEVYAQIAQAEKEYEDGKAEGERKIAEAKAELAKKKAESLQQLDDSEKQIEEAKETLKTTKEEKEKEISDGWETYHEKKEEAEEELEKARKEIEELGTDNYLINDRFLTGSFSEYESSITTGGMFEICFLPLFALVAGTVFFSTIAIIIDEQKKQVGAVKALGFFNKEILVKYMLFAGVGSLLGIAFGIVIGYFLTKTIINPVCDSYDFGKVDLLIAWKNLLVISTVSFVVGMMVAFLACRNLLKCSAVGLINGSEPVKRVMKGNKRKTKEGGLYSRLIINNIRMDWERVLVSVVVIAGSCILIGFGFTVRNAFNKARDIQLNKINNYTVQAVFGDNDDEKIDEVAKMVSDVGGSSIKTRYTAGLVDVDGSNEAMFLISGDPEELKDYITVKKNYGGELPIPKEGALLPAKLYERLKSPDQIRVYNRKLNGYKMDIAGDYEYHIGYVGLTSVETYEKTYLKEYKPNCLFIKCDSISLEELEGKILDISDDIKLYRPDYLLTKGENVKKLFDIATIIFVSLAIILSFMILINLTNILVNRRMKEMLVMRINGFSLRETIGYVARESIFTFCIGIAVGIIGGVLFSIFMIPITETVQLFFVRSPYPPAWVMALLLNILFTVCIDAIAFRKVAKIPVTDISKY
ncbi:MAG: FtsX-like permease family protein [Lachnospiraceae bacterium]|nr:FtsX-like permease family protein [Lachnospiraceae bacterium]